MAILRWGILGAGSISSDFTLALKGVEGSKAVAVATSSSLERAQEFATKHSIATAYGSYESLLADDNVDVVYVGTLNTTHHPVVLQALKAGKHVLCEKPLAVCARQVKEMVACARQHKRFLMEAMWSRFFPALVKVRELIRDGVIGDVRQVDASFGVEIPLQFKRVWQLESAGGSLLDLGVYPLYFASMCYAENGVACVPTNIKAMGKLSQSGIDKWCTIVLDYSKCEGAEDEKEGGAKHAVVTSTITVRTTESFVISGTKGNIRVNNGHYPYDLTLTVFGKDQRFDPPTVQNFTFPKGLVSPQKDDTVQYVYPGSEGLAFQAQAVQEAIAAGQLECKEMSLDESVIMAEVMDEARRQIGVRFPQDDEKAAL